MTGSENDHENMAIWLGFPTETELGGKIIFPKNHDIGVETFQGSALFWYSKFKNGFDDERTQFARCPIIQGNPTRFCNVVNVKRPPDRSSLLYFEMLPVKTFVEVALF